MQQLNVNLTEKVGETGKRHEIPVPEKVEVFPPSLTSSMITTAWFDLQAQFG